MAQDFGQGIFTMEFIKSVEDLDLIDAKAKAYSLIHSSTANVVNRQKATKMLNDSRTMKNLLLGMSNFMLSHSGLKTVR